MELFLFIIFYYLYMNNFIYFMNFINFIQTCVFTKIVYSMTPTIDTLSDSINDPFKMALNAFLMIMYILFNSLYVKINNYSLSRYLLEKYNHLNSVVIQTLFYKPFKYSLDYGFSLMTRLLLKNSLPPIENINHVQKQYNLESKQECEDFLDSLY